MATIYREEDPWQGIRNPLFQYLTDSLERGRQAIQKKKANIYRQQLQQYIDAQNNQSNLINGTPQPEGYNDNPYAAVFHQTNQPLQQFDMGTANIVPQVQQAQKIPTLMDYERAAAEIGANPRFSKWLSPDEQRNAMLGLYNANEQARNEQKQKEAAAAFNQAMGLTGKTDALTSSLISGSITPDIFNPALNGVKYGYPYQVSGSYNDGQTMHGFSFDPVTGAMTNQIGWDNYLSPQDQANYAHLADMGARQDWQFNADLAERQRQFDATQAYNQSQAAWNRAYQQNQLDMTGRQIEANRLQQEQKYYVDVINGLQKRRDELTEQLNNTTDKDVVGRNAITAEIKQIDAQLTSYRNMLQDSSKRYTGLIEAQRMRGQPTSNSQGQNFSNPQVANHKYGSQIQKYATQYGVDPELIVAMMSQESGANPNAKSKKGAQGLMQLMPATARSLGVADPWDPEQNIAGGVRYIAQFVKKYNGDIEKALWAYNAGPGNVAAGRMPPETQKYIRNIMAKYRELIKQRQIQQSSIGPWTNNESLPPVSQSVDTRTVQPQAPQQPTQPTVQDNSAIVWVDRNGETLSENELNELYQNGLNEGMTQEQIEQMLNDMGYRRKKEVSPAMDLRPSYQTGRI